MKALEVKSRLAPSEFKDKDHQNKEGAIRADPFMPYEKNLFVGEIGAYNVILNKFPVIRNHFLLTTKGISYFRVGYIFHSPENLYLIHRVEGPGEST